MQNQSIPRLVVCGCILALAGCGDNASLQRTFGLYTDAPDEFTVTTRAPLSMPPDFALRPPQPGAPRPQEQTQTKSAEATLAPDMALAQPSAADSPGQDALLRAAGPPPPPDIRSKLAAEGDSNDQDQYLIDRLIFWKDPPPPGVVVDPQKESERLRQDAALGQSPESGGDTPVIRRKERSLFDSLF
jgi:hypothetical protein